MTVQIDRTLIYRTRRRSRSDGLTPGERVAINIFAYGPDKVPIAILSKVFKVSRNTIYYKALTGEADSYPNTKMSNLAAETKALIEELGLDEAQRQFVTDKMTRAINYEMARVAERRKIKEEKRAARRRSK